jgi:hypothetical protein
MLLGDSPSFRALMIAFRVSGESSVDRTRVCLGLVSAGMAELRRYECGNNFYGETRLTARISRVPGRGIASV